MGRLKDKIIVITGASQGIGKEMAITYSRDGAKVVLISRNKEKMYAFSSKLKNDFLIFSTDIRNEISIRNLMETIISKFGKIDILINNAGHVKPMGLLEMTLEDWDDVLSTNLTGTFICTKEAVKYMKKTGGKIINIASTAGLSPRPGWSSYAASKAGVINFSLTMAEELRAYNIKVFVICPGRTATDLRKKLAPNEDPTTIMQPKTIVEIVEYCMLDKANVLEGQPILVRERK